MSEDISTTTDDKADFEREEFAGRRIQAHPDRIVEDLRVVDVDAGERHRKRHKSTGAAQL